MFDQLQAELSRCSDVSAAAHCALYFALQATKAKLGNIQLIDGRRRYLEIVAQSGFHGEFLSCFKRVSASDPSACGRALTARRQVVIENVTRDPEFAPFSAVAVNAGFLSVQSTPLVSKSGALYGIVSTHREDAGSPSEAQLALMREIAEATANAMVLIKSDAEAMKVLC